jgi:hypothetical protein
MAIVLHSQEYYIAQYVCRYDTISYTTLNKAIQEPSSEKLPKISSHYGTTTPFFRRSHTILLVPTRVRRVVGELTRVQTILHRHKHSDYPDETKNM